MSNNFYTNINQHPNNQFQQIHFQQPQQQQYVLNDNSNFTLNNLTDHHHFISHQQHRHHQQQQQPQQQQQHHHQNVLEYSGVSNMNLVSNPVHVISHHQATNNANMSAQTAQIVLLPTAQNLNNTQPQQQHQQLQMILPTNELTGNTGNYQIAHATSFPTNVSVLAVQPTAFLITDKAECILITQQQNSTPSQPLPQATALTNPHQLLNTSSIAASNCPQTTHFLTQESSNQECGVIALTNPVQNTAVMATENPAMAAGNNCQIVVPLIGTNQISILQPNTESIADSNRQQPFLLIETTVDTNDILEASAPDTNGQFDVDSFLTSTNLSATTQNNVNTFGSNANDNKSQQTPQEAKKWLRDSCIVNRALKALKKANLTEQDQNQRIQNSQNDQNIGNRPSNNQQQLIWR